MWLCITAQGSPSQSEKLLQRGMLHISSHQVQKIGTNSLSPNPGVYFPEFGELLIQILIFHSCLYGCAKSNQVAWSFISCSLCRNEKLDLLGARNCASDSAAMLTSKFAVIIILKRLWSFSGQTCKLISLLFEFGSPFFFSASIVKSQLNALYLKHGFLNTENDG